jgi:uncharacterized protein
MILCFKILLWRSLISAICLQTLETNTVRQYIMQDEQFEWDDTKNASNLAKHGVGFNRARLVFADAFAVAEYDDRESYEGEERFTIVGMVEGTLIFVAYTERGERVRIINARQATKHEQDDYYTQNSSGY